MALRSWPDYARIKSGLESVVSERRLVAVVDDDPSVRAATRNLLQAAGFLTAAFDSAQSFLQSRRRDAVACLVTDMQMPGMTGIELCQRLAASGKPLPAVLITGYPDDALKARARQAGIRCYLPKPFSPEELCECVRSALASTITPKS